MEVIEVCLVSPSKSNRTKYTNENPVLNESTLPRAEDRCRLPGYSQNHGNIQVQSLFFFFFFFF
jgi:hypothetical protein